MSNINETHSLIRDGDEVVYGDAGYIGIEKRLETSGASTLADKEYRIAEKIGRWRRLKGAAREWADREGKRKSPVCSKVEDVFRTVKIQSGYTKTACRGLKKNGERLLALLASACLSMLALAGRTLEGQQRDQSALLPAVGRGKG